MGAKNLQMFHFFFVGGHKKKHRPTKLFTPFEALYKTCLRERNAPKVGQISATLRTRCAHGGAHFHILNCCINRGLV